MAKEKSKTGIEKDERSPDPSTAVLDPARLKRSRPLKEPEERVEDARVSAGAIDKVVDLAFNPSRDKIREVTIIDLLQGRLLPQLDMVELVWQHVIEVATYRQDSVEYARLYKMEQPIPPNIIDWFVYRTAQWQKSIKGRNLEKMIDIALAETEARAGEEDELGERTDAWRE